MLSLDAATTSAERFAFLPLGDLISADRGPWMECLKAFLAATQLLEHDPAGAISILNALGQAPFLRYLTWTCSADPEPLLRFHNDQAFLIETREALSCQQEELFSAVANDLGTGPIGALQVQRFWRDHSALVLQTFQRLCTLYARASAARNDDEGREEWCHRGLMACVIFGLPISDELETLAEGDEWHLNEQAVALRFARRWRTLVGQGMAVSQA